MLFSETHADELIKKYNLSNDVIKAWKFRNTIPDKYSQDLKKPIESSRDLQQLVHLNTALDTGKINLSNLCKLAGAGITIGMLTDFRRQKGLLKQEDLIALKKAFNMLRILFSKVLAEFEKNGNSEIGINLFKSLFNRNEIVWFVFFDRDRSIYQKFSAWKLKRRVFPVEEVTQLKSLILIFLTETSI